MNAVQTTYLRKLLGRLRARQQWEALKVVAAYAVVSTLWILFSDQVLYWLSVDHGLNWLTKVQSAKGMVFVTVSAGVLYFFVTRAFTTLRTSDAVLLDCEERFHQFMENAPTACFMKDAHGKYVFVNNQWCTLFKKSPEEVYERTDTDIWSAEISSSFAAAEQLVLTSGKKLETREEISLLSEPVHFVRFPVSDSLNRRSVAGFIYPSQ